MSKISVIIPIFNAEKYLENCIDSVLKQKVENIEIVLINDGSTDNSGKIAKEYLNKYPTQIKYFEKENGGVSDARNLGLKYATGDYIAFLDSDDYITDNLFKDLEPYMEKKLDMIKYKISKVGLQGDFLEENRTQIFEEKTGEEAFEILYKQDKLIEAPWGYLYKREFWKENNFEYKKGLYHEDFGLTPLIILKAKKVASTDIGYYNYVQTSNSITRGNDKTTYKRAQDLLVHYDNMLKEIEKYNISDKSKDNIKIYYTNAIILAINNLNGEEEKQYIEEIKKRKMINNIKARNLKQLIKKIILKINIKWYLKLRKE